MKLRLLPVAVSVVISSFVLFGGWFAYNSFAMESPLSDIIDKAPGVEQGNLDLTSDTVRIELTLQPDADLREIVQNITNEGSSIIGKRGVQFVTTDQSSPELNAWWSKALFDVAQAMETKHYAEIPVALEKHAADMPGLKVNTQMDDKNVYIRLSDGEHSKYVILPRVAAQMGVWPHE